MATETVIPPANGAALPIDALQERAVLFKPFAWTDVPAQATVPAHAAACFADQARDIANGVSVLLSVLERDEIDAASEDEEGRPLPRLIGVCEAGWLWRLSITALKMLADEAQGQAEWLQARAAAPVSVPAVRLTALIGQVVRDDQHSEHVPFLVMQRSDWSIPVASHVIMSPLAAGHCSRQGT